FNRLNLLGKYNVQTKDEDQLTLGFSHFTSSWDASGQIPERAVEDGTIGWFGAIDDTEGGETSRTNLMLRYLDDLENDKFLEHELYWSQYEFYLVSNFTFFLEDPVNGDQITQEEDRNIIGYKARWVDESTFGHSNLTSEIGAGFRYDDVDDIRLSRTKNRREILENLALGDIEETNIYVYGSETWKVSNRFIINAGLRYDHLVFQYTDRLLPNYSREKASKGILSPKLQLDYQLSENATLYAKAGTGFHSNDTRVVVAREADEILPRASGADLGLILKPLPRLTLQAALWTLHLEQEFVYVGDAAVVEPSGETRRRGIDVSLRYQLTPSIYIDSDVNFTDPVALNAPEGEDFIPLAPTFTSTGGILFQRPDGYGFNGSLRYRWLGDRAANEDNTVIADGYFLLDAVLNYTRPSFEVRVSIVNLLDERWKV
ncbi:MAG: TonB-dependent receptor, partial [Cyclobacteriaceae bacterium]